MQNLWTHRLLGHSPKSSQAGQTYCRTPQLLRRVYQENQKADYSLPGVRLTNPASNPAAPVVIGPVLVGVSAVPLCC